MSNIPPPPRFTHTDVDMLDRTIERKHERLRHVAQAYRVRSTPEIICTSSTFRDRIRRVLETQKQGEHG